MFIQKLWEPKFFAYNKKHIKTHGLHKYGEISTDLKPPHLLETPVGNPVNPDQKDNKKCRNAGHEARKVFGHGFHSSISVYKQDTT